MSQNDRPGDRGIVPVQPGGVTELERDEKVAVPSLFKVVLLNDDFTPMEFVIHVLKKYFKKSSPEAEQIMLEVHNKGAGVAGTYTLEVAEMKVLQVTKDARSEEHPLKAIVEEA